MKITSIDALEKISNDIRKDIIEEVYEAQSGHPGGSLSCADILTVLYFNQMNINPQKPNAEGRDRFVLSKGHCSPALYATLARKGYFDKELLKTFRKIGSNLQGHPDMKKIPGVDMTTGSLGQGLSAAVGMALASKIDSAGCRVYCLLGDGEIDEGQIWEAAMTASKNELDNLCVILDNNGLQLETNIDEIIDPTSIADKFMSFGFNVIECDGHSITSLIDAFNSARNKKRVPTIIIAKTVKGKPTVLIANTIKGCGSPVMENKAGWHHHVPNEEEYNEIMKDLEARKEAALHE